MTGEHIHVLLIEDEISQVRLFEELVRDSDVASKVESVSRIADARHALKSFAFDLIVLDLNLPDSEGLETLRAIRRIAPEVPVLVLTGEDAAEVGAEAVELGAEDFLIKGEPSSRSLARCMRFAVVRKRAQNAEMERRNLQGAIEAFRHLLGVVGHELRTPLAAMRLTADHLLNDTEGLDTGHRALLHAIHDESIRMAETVSNLLEAARLNSGAACWHWGTVRLKEVCENAVGLVANLIDSSRVQLLVNIDPDDLEMSGDSDAVRRLIINLLTNAVKHTPQGSIELDVRQVIRCDGRWTEVTVRDTGEGMSQEIADKLGQPFLLNSGVVGADYVKGTGLGLAISRGIAAAHAGSITVRSVRGQGTIFTVLLRADLEQAAELDRQEEIITVEVAA